jgi:hypothetical protein
VVKFTMPPIERSEPGVVVPMPTNWPDVIRIASVRLPEVFAVLKVIFPGTIPDETVPSTAPTIEACVFRGIVSMDFTAS